MSTPTLTRSRLSNLATRGATLRDRLTDLFPDAAPVRLTRAVWLWGILIVALGTAISLARTTGAGPFQTIWEEDARDLLTDALNQPTVFNLIKPAVGYFLVGSRLMAEVATLFPISWAAAVLSIQAALVAALLTVAVYVASGTHLRNPLARFLVSAPMLFSPTAENIVSEIYNRPATIQFFIAYAAFWLILWVPAGRAGRVVQLVTIGLSVVSTFLLVIYIPLALLRLWVRRDRMSFALVGLLVGGALIQASGLILGMTNRGWATPRYDPIWALKGFVWWAVPHSMLGWTHSWRIGGKFDAGQVGTVALGWVLVIGVVVIAFMRLTRPKWLLAAVAGAHCVGLTCMTVMANGIITQRYLLPVELLLFTALVALLMPADGPRRALAHVPLAALACFVLVVSAINYRHDQTWRHQGPLWTEQVRLAYESCKEPERREVLVRSGPAPYYSLVTVPCHVFRIPRWCQPPYCAEIGAGQPGLLLRPEAEE